MPFFIDAQRRAHWEKEEKDMIGPLLTVLEIVDKERNREENRGIMAIQKNLEMVRKGLSYFEGLRTRDPLEDSRFFSRMENGSKLAYLQKIRKEIDSLDKQLERNQSFKKMKKEFALKSIG